MIDWTNCLLEVEIFLISLYGIYILSKFNGMKCQFHKSIEFYINFVQKKAREEEERKIGEAVMERRKQDLEMEKRAR